MRKQFVESIQQLMSQDDRIVVLLGDIGIYAFRNVFSSYPDRIYNVGILEQATVSLAAGLAKEGLIPIFHSIAPFVVERAFEQIKIDFGYQNMNGMFITVGSSYDYASLGCTHHCPGDVTLMKSIPNMQVYTPGNKYELDIILTQNISNDGPKYIRLSERSHKIETSIQINKGLLIKNGSKGIIIVAGPMLQQVVMATDELDVTILYYAKVAPLDTRALIENCHNGKILVVEPFYVGTLSYDIQSAFPNRPIQVRSLGVPRIFLTSYGNAEFHDQECGLDVDGIRKAAIELFQ